jgi:hypothetical protein
MSSKINRVELVQQIENAFADIPYPGDNNLIKKPEHWESWKIPKVLKGKHWKDVSSEEIFELRFNLSHFTLEAFQFYLPAYLIASLNVTSGGEIIENIIFSLDPQGDEENVSSEFLARVGALSSKQKAAIKGFIKYYAETETHQIPDDKRIEQFWENYSI